MGPKPTSRPPFCVHRSTTSGGNFQIRELLAANTQSKQQNPCVTRCGTHRVTPNYIHRVRQQRSGTCVQIFCSTHLSPLALKKMFIRASVFQHSTLSNGLCFTTSISPHTTAPSYCSGPFPQNSTPLLTATSLLSCLTRFSVLMCPMVRPEASPVSPLQGLSINQRKSTLGFLLRSTHQTNVIFGWGLLLSPYVPELLNAVYSYPNCCARTTTMTNRSS